MSEMNNAPISFGQIEADLFVAEATIKKADSMTSKAGKFYRGLAGYHLQQAAEKLIKIQIYSSGKSISNSKMYRHSLDDLITYAESLDIPLIIPKWIRDKTYVITGWEAEGRYDIHFVVRLDTLKKCLSEIIKWNDSLQGILG